MSGFSSFVDDYLPRSHHLLKVQFIVEFWANSAQKEEAQKEAMKYALNRISAPVMHPEPEEKLPSTCTSNSADSAPSILNKPPPCPNPLLITCVAGMLGIVWFSNIWPLSNAIW